MPLPRITRSMSGKKSSTLLMIPVEMTPTTPPPPPEPPTPPPGPGKHPTPAKPGPVNAANPHGPPAAPEPIDFGKPKAEGNAIYRIDTEGFVREIFRQPVMVMSIIEHNGVLLVGTGGDGL